MEPLDQRGGVSLPLFDRLAEDGGLEQSGPPPAGAAGWRESVRREVARLLNTRLAPARRLAEEEAGTVTGYGIPDWTTVNPDSAPELHGLARTIAAQVERFEPRLADVSVVLGPERRSRHAAQGVLRAVARVGVEPVRVSYVLALDALGAEVSAAEE